MALGLAIGLDGAFGDPPNAAHPVAWLGRYARAIEATSGRTRASGVLATASVVASAVGLAAGAVRIAGSAPGAELAAEAALVWACTGRRSLFRHAHEVADALDADDLPEARRLLSFHLVSRETAALDASEVAGATIESVAENLSDGVIAPWFWYAVGGVPAATAHRALNTLDGMWGYRTPTYESFGAAAARADDVANLLPARLTALGIIIAARMLGEDAAGALHAWGSDRGRTLSPNAGHPMSAMAGALGIALEKRGEYRLNERGRAPEVADIRRAVRLADAASLVTAGLLGVALAARGCRR